MLVEATQTLIGCQKCDYTGKAALADGRTMACGCAEERARRMTAYGPLMDRCELRLYQSMTFENFLPQNETQQHALEFVTKMFSGWYLFGDYGVGKTHLMAAMVNELRSKNVPAVIFTETDIMTIMGFKSRSDEGLQKQLESVRYLVIDDLGTAWQSRPHKEKIYQLIDKRWLLGQQGKGYTSFTSQIPFDKLGETYDGRVVDRILGMTLQAVITGQSMRAKGQVKFYEAGANGGGP